MQYYEMFSEVHKLLKEYECYPTFRHEKEYQEIPTLGGTFFYQTLEQEKFEQRILKEWSEKIDAELDVCIKTNIMQAENKQIRFDIKYSQRVKLYSMFISLPTNAKSVPLSKDIYKSQGDIVREVAKWISFAKCKKGVRGIKINKKFEQVSLF